MLFAFILKFKLKKDYYETELDSGGNVFINGRYGWLRYLFYPRERGSYRGGRIEGLSQKELILQDLFDVEYIPLETTDEFVTLGWLQAIGKDVMIIRNMFAADGDIFIYDRKGKAIRHINRKGQGNEEYAATNGIYLDDEKGELFVGNLRQRKIMTYDLFGNFKRSFTFKEGEDEDTKSWVYYKAIFNFDRDHFICQDASSGRNFNGA